MWTPTRIAKAAFKTALTFTVFGLVPGVFLYAIMIILWTTVISVPPHPTAYSWFINYGIVIGTLGSFLVGLILGVLGVVDLWRNGKL